MESNTENFCPRCGDLFDLFKKRLIVEICGHKKCRTCLINENNGCDECKLNIPNDHTLLLIGCSDSKVVNDGLTSKTIEFDTTDVPNQTIAADCVNETDDDLRIDTDGGGVDESSMSRSQYKNCFQMSELKSEDYQKKSLNELDLSITVQHPPTTKKKKRKKLRVVYPDHLVELKVVGGSVFKCTICNKEFKSLNNRRYHFYCDQSLNKPYKCDQCNKVSQEK